MKRPEALAGLPPARSGRALARQFPRPPPRIVWRTPGGPTLQSDSVEVSRRAVSGFFPIGNILDVFFPYGNII